MKRLLSIGLAVGLSLGSCGLATAASFRTVALAGDFPPGTPNVLPVDLVGSQQINDSGLVSFVTVEPNIPIVDPDLRRLWIEEPGGLRLIVSEGDPVPIPPGNLVLDKFGFVETSNGGQSTLRSFLAGPGVDASNQIAVFVEEAGSLKLVARFGDPAPTLPNDVVFDNINSFGQGINATGEVLIRGIFAGPGIDDFNDSAIFLSEAGGLRRIIQDGDPAPGMPVGVNVLEASPTGVGSPSFGQPFNDAGQIGLDVVLNEQFTTDGGLIANRTALYVEDVGSFRLVAEQGDPAPGLPDGVEFQFLESIGIDEAGPVAFWTSLEGPGVVPPGIFGVGGNNQALYSESGGAPELVFRLGDPAQGTDPDVVYSSLQHWTVGGGGDVALLAGLSGPGVVSGNASGIWADTNGTLELIARSGSPAPGTPDGIVFEVLELGPVSTEGQVSFRANVAGDGVDSTNNFGIWATDPSGDLQLIVRKGDELEVASGVFRTVQALTIGETNPDDESNAVSPLNARGEMVFQAAFTDGSTGIFVSSLVAIPEPGTMLLLLGGLAMLTSARCRSR